MLNNLPDPKIIFKEVKENNFVIYENVFNHEILKEIKLFWIDYFAKKDKFKSNDLYGATRSIGDDNYNSFRNEKQVVMYRRSEFPWNKPINDTTKNLIFELNKIRNLALGLNENHGLLFNNDLEVFFSQINNYPSMEGKMFPHRDTKKKEILLSCMFNITFKNIDFEEGGLYLLINDQKIDIDELMSPCSVIFYNGNLIHGVDRIVSKSGIGRIAGYPMKQYFMSKSLLPNYLKKIIGIDNAIRRKFNFKSAIKQGNSAFDNTKINE